MTYEPRTRSKIAQLGRVVWLNRSVNRDQAAVEIVIFPCSHEAHQLISFIFGRFFCEIRLR